MKQWKMTQTLSLPQDPGWDKLIQKLYPNDIHKNLKQETLLSRQALLLACEELGIKLEIEDLILKGYSEIIKLPQYTISLSHTKNCGAAMVADKKSFLSVGIDIELSARVVGQNIHQRIGHPEDLNLPSIEIWCLKEAAFKAMMNSGKFEKPQEFSSIKVSDKCWSHSASGIEGEWELETSHEFIIARAFLRN